MNQDLRLGALPPHRGVVGHDRAGELNMAPGFGASNMYSHAFPDPTAPVGDPPRGSLRLPNSELSNLSAADLYRRQHEVTAVVRLLYYSKDIHIIDDLPPLCFPFFSPTL